MKLDKDMKKREFADRLLTATKANGMDEYGKYSAIARHFGLTAGAVKRWFDAENLPAARMDELAKYLRVRPEWLRTGKGAMREIEGQFSDGTTTTVELHSIPVIEPEEYRDWIAGNLSKSDLPTVITTGSLPATAFCIRVADNSLYDKVLKGMFVIIDPERKNEKGALTLAIVDESFVMGHLTKRGNFFLEPPNQDYRPTDLGLNPEIAGTLVSAVPKPLLPTD